ncbi:hypothetical protein HYDPIDRAFT_38131 [Hydnomerulius pinastri MD-312]|nr:hypothetical protein HYDPIDRAFT_38131 [Hydnomerulius pinastri MD-312]
MKDASYSRSTPPPQGNPGAPYRKRKGSSSRGGRSRYIVDDTNSTRSRVSARDRRRANPPCSDRTLARSHSHWDDAVQGSYPISLDYSSFSDAHGSNSKPLAGERSGVHDRSHTEESYLESPSLRVHADATGSSLRLSSAHIPQQIPELSSPTNKPPVKSAETFLRSIELGKEDPTDDRKEPARVPLPPTPISLAPPSLCLPASPTGIACDAARTAAPTAGYQVNLIHQGHSLTYDLSTLPDDPAGPIALLSATQSDPGGYLLTGAHYRRTGRPRAACSVLRALLGKQQFSPDSEKDNSPTGSESGLSSTSSVPQPAFKAAALRPAMLLLAACELDISREEPLTPESSSHASAAHGLFRAVYGTTNDAIVPGAERPRCHNALGLDFASNGHGSSSSASDVTSPSLPILAPSVTSARIEALQRELQEAQESQRKMHEKLTAANVRLSRAETQLQGLQARSRDALLQLDSVQEESQDLRRRLAEAEQRAAELENGAAGAETRVWGRLRDMLFDQVGGGLRGEQQ